jgi:hypothetical protein
MYLVSISFVFLNRALVYSTVSNKASNADQQRKMNHVSGGLIGATAASEFSHQPRQPCDTFGLRSGFRTRTAGCPCSHAAAEAGGSIRINKLVMLQSVSRAHVNAHTGTHLHQPAHLPVLEHQRGRIKGRRQSKAHGIGAYGERAQRHETWAAGGEDPGDGIRLQGMSVLNSVT